MRLGEGRYGCGSLLRSWVLILFHPASQTVQISCVHSAEHDFNQGLQCYLVFVQLLNVVLGIATMGNDEDGNTRLLKWGRTVSMNSYIFET